jgi:glutaconate CoA-transferase subunit A
MEHLKTYTGLATEADGWQRYVSEFVALPEEQYLERVGGTARLAALPPPVF